MAPNTSTALFTFPNDQGGLQIKMPGRVGPTQGIVSRFMLFVPCHKSMILHCKKARAKKDMSLLQWYLNIHKLDGLYHIISARTQHSCHHPIPIPYTWVLKKIICPLDAEVAAGSWIQCDTAETAQSVTRELVRMMPVQIFFDCTEREHGLLRSTD